MPPRMPYGCMPLIFLAGLLIVPFLLANLTIAALARLGLSLQMTVLAAVGIFVGGSVNIPIARLRVERPVQSAPAALFGLPQVQVGNVYREGYVTIAVNLGGCIIPTLVAGYQLVRIAEAGLPGIAASPIPAS